MAITNTSTPSYYNQLNTEQPNTQGFKRQTYTGLAQQPTDAIIPNPDDVVMIESHINPETTMPLEEGSRGLINPNMPAVCPLKESPKASWWTLMKTNPFGQHAKQWGFYSAGVGLGSLMMSAVFGTGQQIWKATNEANAIQTLKIETPAWWQQKQAVNTCTYKAEVSLPNNPWSDTNQLNLEMEGDRQVYLQANGKPALSLEKRYFGDKKDSVFFEVKFLDAATIEEHSTVKKEFLVAWDTTEKEFSVLDNAIKDLDDKLKASITNCLQWLHEPETLKTGLKQDKLLPHLEGLKGSVGLAVFLAGLSGLIGAGIWQFHKRPKPIKAEESNLNSLPSA